MRDDFHNQLVAALPRLRVQALALARSRAAAADLVQDAVVNALRARHSFTPGTNFAAWIHRILRNRFISDCRRRRETIGLGDDGAFGRGTAPTQEDRLTLKALRGAIARLEPYKREALLMVVIEGMSYEEIAEATGCLVGTAKSRVARTRSELRAWLLGAPLKGGPRGAGRVGRCGGPASRDGRRSGAPPREYMGG